MLAPIESVSGLESILAEEVKFGFSSATFRGEDGIEGSGGAKGIERSCSGVTSAIGTAYNLCEVGWEEK